jgi:hypothetical protein
MDQHCYFYFIDKISEFTKKIYRGGGIKCLQIFVCLCKDKLFTVKGIITNNIKKKILNINKNSKLTKNGYKFLKCWFLNFCCL